MNGQVNIPALTVTDVNRYIKSLLNSDEVLSAVTIRGEISNFKAHGSGHLYFTLKDEGAEIAAVMFRGDASRLAFRPADGMRVVVYGSVDVYEKSGRYQVYVRTMQADGVGAMMLAFERLKRKLTAEGLFDEARKRPLPPFPTCVGVITAPTGAAIQDILNITGRRYPQAKILLYPSLVQGAEAPASLCAGLATLNALEACDVIILGRGGGSLEDLWAFNDEALVRAVAASRIPVISAVGHETDFTLCDFAADRRAPTPSAAAELAVPDRRALTERLAQIKDALQGSALARVQRQQQRLLQKIKACACSPPKGGWSACVSRCSTTVGVWIRPSTADGNGSGCALAACWSA
jgi:exodeoxyribonuclease VII large subunit